jgi:catechol 2,3-dioxygenase-like lactoylglutathione lyase family enzyme
MTMILTHGAIMGGVVAVPDLDAALADYQGVLGFRQVDHGIVGQSLAASWGCPGNAGSRMATLQPVSGSTCFIRLVEQPIPDGFVPTRSFGWASYEITVQDVFGWPARIAATGFDIIGEPKEIPGLPYFVAMQVYGRGREMLYFNEVRENTPTSDLPKAESPMDNIFIVILAAKDRLKSLDWYKSRLNLDEGDTYTIAYGMINNAFGLPADTMSSLTMVQAGRMPIVEVDDYPAATIHRPTAPGCLPPGNSLVTLAVQSLDTLDVDWISPPTKQAGPVYAGRRSGTVRGPSGELLELIELG